MEVRLLKCKANSHSHSLSIEILEDILSRLPVKSLCRFRCVSKSWQSLISDPKFVKLHSDRAFQNKHVFRQRQRVIYTDVPLAYADKNSEPHYLYCFDLNSNMETLNDCDFKPAKLNRVFSKLKHFWITWASHCNGLLLFKLRGQSFNRKNRKYKELLYLLNPATRESKELPPSPNLQGKHCHDELYGLGFDYSIEDYKVVRGKMYRDNGNIFTLFSVYSLKTGSWRVIEKQFPYTCCAARYSAIAVNGALHWLMNRSSNGDQSRTILSLLLSNEEVREIPLPPLFSIGFMVLGAVREERLFITMEEGAQCKNIWVMMEYGNAESWTHMRVSVSIPHCYLSQYCNWDPTWDLVIECEELLSLYNRNEDSYLCLELRGIGRVGSVGVYLESLASLNNGNAGPLQDSTSKLDPSKFSIVEYPF